MRTIRATRTGTRSPDASPSATNPSVTTMLKAVMNPQIRGAGGCRTSRRSMPAIKRDLDAFATVTIYLPSLVSLNTGSGPIYFHPVIGLSDATTRRPMKSASNVTEVLTSNRISSHKGNPLCVERTIETIVRPIQATNMTRNPQRSGVDKTRPAKCLWNHVACRTVGSPPVDTYAPYQRPYP
jgi:hypothetical protein